MCIVCLVFLICLRFFGLLVCNSGMVALRDKVFRVMRVRATIKRRVCCSQACAAAVAAVVLYY